jgi:hypothetical protein
MDRFLIDNSAALGELALHGKPDTVTPILAPS